MNAPPRQPESPPIHRGEATDDEMAEIRAVLKGLQYGYVQIVVQDGLIVQIDRTEKRRLHRRKSAT